MTCSHAEESSMRECTQHLDPHTQKSTILFFISAKPGKVSSWSEVSSPQHTWNLNPLAGRGPQRQKSPFFHFILCVCVCTHSCVCRRTEAGGDGDSLSSWSSGTIYLVLGLEPAQQAMLADQTTPWILNSLPLQHRDSKYTPMPGLVKFWTSCLQGKHSTIELSLHPQTLFKDKDMYQLCAAVTKFSKWLKWRKGSAGSAVADLSEAGHYGRTQQRMKLTLRQPGSHRCEEPTSSNLFQACPWGPTSFQLGCRPEISITSRDQIFNRCQHCREVLRCILLLPWWVQLFLSGSNCYCRGEDIELLISQVPLTRKQSGCLTLLIPFHSTASYDAFPARAQ